jgi:hypothetical protein
MPLTIRVPKTYPELDRRTAREMAQEIAEADGYRSDELQKSSTRLERVERAVSWEYVVEFPDASS